jgi:acetoin utilization protein AcuB
MNAGQFISAAVIPLKTSDTGIFALSMMEEYRVSHLPIVNDHEYLGLISDRDIYALNNVEEPVGNHNLSNNRPYVTEIQHVYEVVKTISSLKLTLLPVLDQNNQYLGVINLSNVIHLFSQIFAIDNPGGIIVLEINEKDYLLTEIAQIIESNDAKILNLYITSIPDKGKMEVTLKVNKIDIGPILQTFSRYNYTVNASYFEDTYSEGLQERYDSFMNYLNV